MYEYKVKEVVKVVDGDTVDLVLDLGFGLYKKERVRVAGIDAPESRTRDKQEKQYGLAAKAWMKGMLSDCEGLTVRTEKDGKYGRMLGWLYKEDLCINTRMIEAGFAWAYDGGKKLEGIDRFVSLDEARDKYKELHGL